jgi:hypothetical protein
MAVRLSALRADVALLQKCLLELISVRSLVNSRAIVGLGVLGKYKKCNVLFWTRTRDLPVCGIAPQPSTLLSVPVETLVYIFSKSALVGDEWSASRSGHFTLTPEK